MISRTDLERVSTLHDESNHLLSLYLPLFQDKSDVDHNIQIKNRLRDANQRFEHTFGTPLPGKFEALFEDIRVLIRDNAGSYGRGIALFASPDRGIIETFPMPGTIESSAIVDQRANVAPLIRLIEDHSSYCTCVVSRDEARIWLGNLDELEEHAQLEDDEVPGQHDQGGWSQARFERHIEDHVHRHFKRVAQTLFALHQEKRFKTLILGGPEEVVSGFKEFLHPYVQERVVGDVRLLMEANINDVRDRSLELIEQYNCRRKKELIEQVQNEAFSNDLGVGGLTDTIDALQRGQVLNLVVDHEVRSSGVICQECGSNSVTPGPGDTCLYCQSNSVRDVDNIIPYLITSAFRQNAHVTIIDDDEQKERLARLGGVAALLRFRVEEQSA